MSSASTTLARAALALLTATLAWHASAQTQKFGAGAVQLQARSGDAPVPAAPYRTEAALKLAAPTNQWYSSLIFSDKPEAIYAQPLSVKATATAFEVAKLRYTNSLHSAAQAGFSLDKAGAPDKSNVTSWPLSTTRRPATFRAIPKPAVPIAVEMAWAAWLAVKKNSEGTKGIASAATVSVVLTEVE